MKLPIKNRFVAGHALAKLLKATIKDNTLSNNRGNNNDVIVLALPRGGVPIAFEIAMSIGAPLDLMVVRKLGLPTQPELAMGAIANDGIRILNEEIIRCRGISDSALNEIEEREKQELNRRLLAYRGSRPMPNLKSKLVILVDDGVATGACIRAAIQAARNLQAERIIIAAPVVASEVIDSLRKEVEHICCLATPSPFLSVGFWYNSFPQLKDHEVTALLNRAWRMIPTAEISA